MKIHRCFKCTTGASTRCDNWSGTGSRCANNGTVTLYAPDGIRVPGGEICEPCATRITTEYKNKLGEVWTFEVCGNVHT